MGRALHKVRVMAVYSPFAAVRPDAFARLSIQVINHTADFEGVLHHP